jgi:hypothetical protein
MRGTNLGKRKKYVKNIIDKNEHKKSLPDMEG